MEQYLKLLKDIQAHGTIKPAARENMPSTQSLFGYQYRHALSKGFPLLTTKKMYWKGVVVELMWFLRGDTNIKYLDMYSVRKMWHEDAYNYYKKMACDNEHDVKVNQIYCPVSNAKNIRNSSPEDTDAYSLYTFEEFCNIIKNNDINALKENYSYYSYTLGDCGHQYGKVWRDWEGVDQIQRVLNSIKNSPDSRRHIVTAVNPEYDTDLALYWCHAMFQFNCRHLTIEERLIWLQGDYQESRRESDIDLHLALDKEDVPKYYLDCNLYQRSADTFLGLPLNLASYSLLTHIIANESNMIPGDFIHTLGDVHIYSNHEDAVAEQLSREPMQLPTLELTEDITIENIASGKIDVEQLMSCLKNYESHEKIEAKLSTGLK